MRIPKGKDAFENYYRNLFNHQEEFESLIDSLKNKTLPILRFKPENEDKLFQLFRAKGLSWKKIDWYGWAVEWPKEVVMGEELPGYKDRLFYPMSQGSLLPVLALNVQANDWVLDACAAPGGKALMISEKLRHPNQLLANELSYDRAMRMKRVFNEYGQDQIQIRIGPAEKLWKKTEILFDKVLVDAPCSSEAHVYRSKEHLSRWSHNRIKKLAHRQKMLVASLVEVVKPGGQLVYSTCAITPEENEMVVEDIIKKFGDKIELVNLGINPWPGEAGFKTEGVSFDASYVKRIWPQRFGMEPMFIARFAKKD